MQRAADVVDLVAGDADSAAWTFEVTTGVDPEGADDFKGSYVHGRRGDRFVYLSWGTVDSAGRFEMFRRAKLHFNDVDPGAVRAAMEGGGTLVGRVGLTDGCGHPRCARVRPPAVDWTCESG